MVELVSTASVSIEMIVTASTRRVSWFGSTGSWSRADGNLKNGQQVGQVLGIDV